MLPLASRTLATSNFKAAYDRNPEPPADPMTLGMLLADLIRGYCRKEGCVHDRFSVAGSLDLQPLKERRTR